MTREAGGKPPQSISPDELRTQLDLGNPPVVIDVRTADEYTAGHVPGAVNVPFWKVLASGLPTDVKSTDPIVVYCGHGPRAHMAMLGMRLRGFTNLCELDGHWVEWQARRFPVARGTQP